MITFPNAKINLGLDILRKRDDGYHDISTVMLPVPWCDVLEIVPAKGPVSTLTVTGNAVACEPEKNLVMKALRLVQAECGCPEVDIFLRKQIPDGAGLGGGSADAAFTITMLNSMFSLGLTQSRMEQMAAKLGADCPLFIANRPVLATGTGTELHGIDLNLKGMKILIVKPLVSVPTKEAYSRVCPQVPRLSVAEILKRPVSQWQGVLKNDFEPSVFAAHPVMDLIKQAVINLGALYCSMSGSGSAIYGLFPAGTDILTAQLTQQFPGSRIFVSDL